MQRVDHNARAASRQMPNLEDITSVLFCRVESSPYSAAALRTGEEARDEGLDAGADDYLVKPFSARELLARVASNIRLARVRKESQAATEPPVRLPAKQAFFDRELDAGDRAPLHIPSIIPKRTFSIAPNHVVPFHSARA